MDGEFEEEFEVIIEDPTLFTTEEEFNANKIALDQPEEHNYKDLRVLHKFFGDQVLTISNFNIHNYSHGRDYREYF